MPCRNISIHSQCCSVNLGAEWWFSAHIKFRHKSFLIQGEVLLHAWIYIKEGGGLCSCLLLLFGACDAAVGNLLYKYTYRKTHFLIVCHHSASISVIIGDGQKKQDGGCSSEASLCDGQQLSGLLLCVTYILLRPVVIWRFLSLGRTRVSNFTTSPSTLKDLEKHVPGLKDGWALIGFKKCINTLGNWHTMCGNY